MSPYLYRRLMREKLAQLRQEAGAGHAPPARSCLAFRPQTPELFPVEHVYAAARLLG